MNLRILGYFVTVAHEKNITRAADILHITQPTLSRQLMQLEEELGVKLFERGQNKFALTSAGNLLLARAKDIMELIEKTESDLRDQETNLSGNIVIGVGEIEAVEVLSDILKAFHQLHADVSFDILTGTSDVIKDKMEKGIIDIALFLEPIDMQDYEYIELPNQEVFGVLMRKDAPLSKKESISASDLANFPLLLPSRLTVRSSILNWLSGSIANINIIGTCNLHGNARVLVDHMYCYAITVGSKYFGDEHFAFRPLNPAITSKVYLARRRGVRFSVTLQKFYEFAKCFLSMKREKI